MKCIVCRKRKGKRFCPAKNTRICAQCCGEKRVVEIPCPPDCGYLAQGQSYQSVKKYLAQLQQVEDPERRRKLYENSVKYEKLLRELETAVIAHASGLSTFSDQEILEAVTLLAQSYRTEEKGLLYDHSSPNPLVQALVRELKPVLEKRRKAADDEEPLLRLGDILQTLEVLESDIRYHLAAEGTRDSYLRFITRNHPELVSEPTGSQIVLP